MSAHARLRLTQARLLTASSPRAAAWQPLVAVGAVGLVVVHQALHGPEASPGSAPARLDFLLPLLAGAAAFVIDDPAGATVAPSPAALWLRRALRVGWAGTLLAVTGAAVALYASTGPAGVPWGRLSLALVALALVAMAGATLGERFAGDRLGGSFGAALPLATVAAAAMLPDEWWFYPANLQVPGATGALVRTALGAAVVIVALSRDPAHRPILRRPFRHRTADEAVA